VKIYNNTFYQNGLVALELTGTSTDTNGIEVKNNIFYQSANSACKVNCSWYPVMHIAIDGNPATIISNNYYGPGAVDIRSGSGSNWTTKAIETTPITGTVQFVGATDFHLNSGSIVIDKGAAVLDVPKDMDGVIRPQGSLIDIGAFEYFGSISNPPPPNPTPTPITIQLAPTTASLSAGQSNQFNASVTGTPNLSVNWSINPAIGSISASGLYTAPATITTAQNITLTANPVADFSKSAYAQISLIPTVVVPPPPPPPTTNIVVSVNQPNIIFLGSTETNKFNASVIGTTTNTAVTWAISPAIGSISASGLYTAPVATTRVRVVKVTATSVADPKKSDKAFIVLY
jgi:hypothetical protein